MTDDRIVAAARAMAHADGYRWHDEPPEGRMPLPLADPAWWSNMAERALTAARKVDAAERDDAAADEQAPPRVDYSGEGEIDAVCAALADEQWDGRVTVEGRDVRLADPYTEIRRKAARPRAIDLLRRLDAIRPPGQITGDPDRARAAAQRIVEAQRDGGEVDPFDVGIVAAAAGGRP